jgi:hypothetical protein
MKIDRYIKNISDRLDNISNDNGNAASNEDRYRIDKYDDEYYLTIGEDPLRFRYYRQARAEKWKALQEQGHYKPSDTDPSYTQDEIDFALKRELRKTKEQRYLEEKANFLFHDLSCYMRGLSDEDHGCTGAGCIPECRFYPDTGVIEDDEVIEKYKNLAVSKARKCYSRATFRKRTIGASKKRRHNITWSTQLTFLAA